MHHYSYLLLITLTSCATFRTPLPSCLSVAETFKAEAEAAGVDLYVHEGDKGVNLAYKAGKTVHVICFEHPGAEAAGCLKSGDFTSSCEVKDGVVSRYGQGAFVGRAPWEDEESDVFNQGGGQWKNTVATPHTVGLLNTTTR